ncbi:MAG TPA: hypothetical protein VNB24_03805 [Acidimicrobiales bacterium]|nr:hypothetical protein [Acidimicrobiales bacterium]
MRRTMLRALLIALIPLGLSATPTEAAKDIPEPCDIVNNVYCHCLSPTSTVSCVLID